MINILDIVPEIKHLDSTYINAMQLKLNDYLSYAEISPGLAHHNIDITKLPRRLGILKTNISQIVDEGYCLAFNFINYKNTGKLSALLIEQYFRNSILNDTTLNNIVYCTHRDPRPVSVTIRYTPDFQDVSEIQSQTWIDYLIRMATANMKIALGRARSKYTVEGSNVSLDGDTLLSEGNAELEQIREELENRRAKLVVLN